MEEETNRKSLANGAPSQSSVAVETYLTISTCTIHSVSQSSSLIAPKKKKILANTIDFRIDFESHEPWHLHKTPHEANATPSRCMLFIVQLAAATCSFPRVFEKFTGDVHRCTIEENHFVRLTATHTHTLSQMHWRIAFVSTIPHQATMNHDYVCLWRSVFALEHQIIDGVRYSVFAPRRTNVGDECDDVLRMPTEIERVFRWDDGNV